MIQIMVGRRAVAVDYISMKDHWKTLLDEQHRSLCGLLQGLEAANPEVRESLAASFRAELRAYFQSLEDGLFPALGLSPAGRSRLDGLRAEHRVWVEHFTMTSLEGDALRIAREALEEYLAYERDTFEAMLREGR